MRRLMIAVVVVGAALSAGVSFAQEEDAPQMPEKVRGFLDGMTGTWNIRGSLNGRVQSNWDAGRSAVVGGGHATAGDMAITWTEFWYWDGRSDDGLVVTWSTATDRGLVHGTIRGRALSKTVFEGQKTGVRHGQPMSADVRIEFQNGDRFTWKEMNVMVAGTKEPDTTDVQTRVDNKAGTAAAIDEITILDKKMWQAIMDRDVETLDRIYADDFIGLYNIAKDGPMWTKEDLISAVKTGKSVIYSYRYDHSEVHVVGEWAAITGVASIQERFDGKDYDERHRFTSVWNSRPTGWQCVSENYAGTSDQTERNKALVRRVMEEIPVDDWDAVSKLHSADFVYHGPSNSVRMNREEFGQDMLKFIAAFPDFSRTIEDMTAEGDRVAVRMTYQGTHKHDYAGIPATDKKVASQAIVMLRIVDGKIAEGWEEYDELSFRQQLGIGTDGESLEGVWGMKEQKMDGNLEDLTGARILKTYQDGNWHVAYYGTSTGKVDTTLGGTYTFDGSTLKETIAYINRDEGLEYVGQTLTYDIRFKDGCFYQSGDFFGQKLEEIWAPAAPRSEMTERDIPPAQLSPAMQKLAVFAGDWVYEGEQNDPPVPGLPYGGAGKFHGTSTTRFILGGLFQESRTEDHNPSGITTVVDMTGYDPKAKNYIVNSYLSDGSRDTSVQTVSPDGRTWTTRTTTTTAAGEQVPLRSVLTLSSDGSRSTSKVEVSLDGGRTWKLWFTAKSRKVGN